MTLIVLTLFKSTLGSAVLAVTLIDDLQALMVFEGTRVAGGVGGSLSK